MPFNAIVFPSDAHKTPEKNAKQTRKCALHFMYMRLSSNVMSYNNRTVEGKRESIKAMTDGGKPENENMIVLLLYRCITSYCFGRSGFVPRDHEQISSPMTFSNKFSLFWWKYGSLLICLMLSIASTLFSLRKGFNAFRKHFLFYSKFLCYFKMLHHFKFLGYFKFQASCHKQNDVKWWLQSL